jgi:hypothetical protein
MTISLTPFFEAQKYKEKPILQETETEYFSTGSREEL